MVYYNLGRRRGAETWLLYHANCHVLSVSMDENLKGEAELSHHVLSVSMDENLQGEPEISHHIEL